MKRLKVIVVGAKFGEVYLQVLLRRKDLVDVVGILGKGGQHSLECSTKYNIPLYTSVSELPSGIDLACVIVRAGVMGGEGIQLSKELLQKGISVLHEQPIHYKELKECYVIAKKQKCFMGVSNLYRYIDATQSFIDLVNHLKKEEYKELFKLVKDDDRIQLIKGRDTHICEIGIEGLSNSIKICNVLIKAVEV